MNKKKWALIILLVLAIFGWYKLFYKTYNINAVAQNADAIVAIDVKRITNTLIWQFITTPSLWKISSSSAKKDSALSWKDIIELPDYILAFHLKNQPNNVWHTKFSVNKGVQIDKALYQYNFKPVSKNEYLNDEYGIYIHYENNQILVTSLGRNNKDYAKQAFDELFTSKKYISEATLKNLITAKSHIAVLINAPNFLETEVIIKANFDKERIAITTSFSPKNKYKFNEDSFEYSKNSLLTFQFAQPTTNVYNLIDTNTKEKISKVLNFSVDSMFTFNNKNYQLTLNNFATRVDSAITYTYDDEFNKIEKVIVNNVQEPVFNFSIVGDNVNKINNYWQQTNLFENTTNGKLFTAIPFAKSYCSQTNSQLNIKTLNYTPLKTDTTITGILNAQLSLSKIPENLLKYLPENIKKAINNLEQIELTAKNKSNQIVIDLIMQKKKNKLPILTF